MKRGKYWWNHIAIWVHLPCSQPVFWAVTQFPRQADSQPLQARPCVTKHVLLPTLYMLSYFCAVTPSIQCRPPLQNGETTLGEMTWEVNNTYNLHLYTLPKSCLFYFHHNLHSKTSRRCGHIIYNNVMLDVIEHETVSTLSMPMFQILFVQVHVITL